MLNLLAPEGAHTPLLLLTSTCPQSITAVAAAVPRQIADDGILDAEVINLVIGLGHKSIRPRSICSCACFQDLDPVHLWPGGELISQQVEQTVESCIRDVHLGSLWTANDSQAPALVGGFRDRRRDGRYGPQGSQPRLPGAGADGLA